MYSEPVLDQVVDRKTCANRIITFRGKQAAQRAIHPAPPASKLSAQQIPQNFLSFLI